MRSNIVQSFGMKMLFTFRNLMWGLGTRLMTSEVAAGATGVVMKIVTVD